MSSRAARALLASLTVGLAVLAAAPAAAADGTLEMCVTHYDETPTPWNGDDRACARYSVQPERWCLSVSNSPPFGPGNWGSAGACVEWNFVATPAA